MDRLTTDKPTGNLDSALNFVIAKNRRAILRYAENEENVDLCEYVSQKSRHRGCDVSADDVMEGSCINCDCILTVLYLAATQAAELRGRLQDIEDILGDTYDLKHLRKLMDADREKRLHTFPCKRGDTIYALHKTWAGAVTGKIIKGRVYGMELGRKGNWVIWYTPEGEPKTNGYALYPKDYQKTWFLSPEEADAALQKWHEGQA